MVNVTPHDRAMICYVCDAELDARRGDVPLCLKCKGGDNENTPPIVTTVTVEERPSLFRKLLADQEQRERAKTHPGYSVATPEGEVWSV